MSVVVFEKVSRIYSGGVRALNDVSITVEEGRVYGILGRNGAGKTTLLRMIPPLLHPTEGEVRVFGQDPWEHEEIRVHLGYMAEYDERPGHMRPEHYFDLCAELYPGWDDRMLRRYLGGSGWTSTSLLPVCPRGRSVRQASCARYATNRSFWCSTSLLRAWTLLFGGNSWQSCWIWLQRSIRRSCSRRI